MNKGNLVATVVAALVLGFVAGYIAGSGTSEKGGALPGAEDVSAEDVDKYPGVAKGLVDNPSYGPADAKVTILEFSEFQ